MPYIIDGHNLIPKIAGMSLRQIDDEEQLMALLQDYQRAKRCQIELFFDQAAPGNAGPRKVGNLKVHFVRHGSTADAAITRRLQTLGKAARNWVVVSSDRRVQGEARAHQAGVVSSEAFAREIDDTLRSAAQQQRSQPPAIHPDEVDEWLEFFKDEDGRI